MVRSEMETMARAAQGASTSLRFEQLLKSSYWKLLREQQEALDQMKVEALMGATNLWPGHEASHSLNCLYARPLDRAN